MSQTTLSSVVSHLVRAQMGSSLTPTVTDDDLDRHVAELILKEAKQKAERYRTDGFRAYLAQSIDSNAPKTNKRFLSSIIKSTDDHNKTILRAQAQAAQEARMERDEQERRERRARAEEAAEAERIRRKKGKDREEWTDTWAPNRGSRKRRHGDGRDGDQERRQRRRHHSRAHDTSQDRDVVRRRHRRSDRSRSRSHSPHRRRRHGEDDVETEGSHRRRRERKRSPSVHDSEEGSHTRRRDRSPGRSHRRTRCSSHSPADSQRSALRLTKDSSRSETYSPSRSHIASSLGAEERERTPCNDVPDTVLREDELKAHLKRKAKGKERERSSSPAAEPAQSRSRSPDSPRKHARRARSRSHDPRTHRTHRSSRRHHRDPPSRRSSSPSPTRKFPTTSSHDRKPFQPGTSSSRTRTRSPTPDISNLPSKMDKYFEESYDPRLDVAPLPLPTIPATGLISDAEFEGWDAMLEIIRLRRQDKEDKKAMERWGIPKDVDKGKGGEKSEVSALDIKYKKKGAVREWDLGKEGF